MSSENEVNNTPPKIFESKNQIKQNEPRNYFHYYDGKNAFYATE